MVQKWYTLSNKYHIGYTIKNILTNKQTYDDILRNMEESNGLKIILMRNFISCNLYSYGSIIKCINTS